MVEIDKAELGQRIKQIRIKRKETLEKFAEAIQKETNYTIKTTKSNVSKWEKGLNTPNDMTLNSIARLGNTSPEWILFGDIPSTVKQLIDEIQDNEITTYNSELYKQLYNPKVKKEITDIILERYLFTNLTPVGMKQYVKTILDQVLTEYKEKHKFMPYNNENAILYSQDQLWKTIKKIDEYFLKEDLNPDLARSFLNKDEIKEDLSEKLYGKIRIAFENLSDELNSIK
ncbi:helix-turn-helix domain-containing protein [Enterococcus italicus]|uniref:helix-turn-helix domain-containing protein n=1 Tax=Enterococcus italicus TaxID=246144 RepID=UPI003FA2A77C